MNNHDNIVKIPHKKIIPAPVYQIVHPFRYQKNMKMDETNLKSEWDKEKDVRPKTKTNASNKALCKSEGRSLPTTMRVKVEGY